MNLANATALFLALDAFGASISSSQALVAYLVGAIVGSATPTPGGLGGTEAALVAGLTGLGRATPTGTAPPSVHDTPDANAAWTGRATPSIWSTEIHRAVAPSQADDAPGPRR